MVSSKQKTSEMESFDNIYLIRFKILYAYYNEYFFGSRNIFRNTDYPDKTDRNFIEKSLMYLGANQYLETIVKDNVDYIYHIKFKGIKFVDRITDGEIYFTDEQIEQSKVKIISLFQKEDLNGY